MRTYSKSKPSSALDPNWPSWSTQELGNIDPDSAKIAALLCIKKNKELCLISKPTLVKNNDGTIFGIIGNMFNDGSLPALIRIDVEDVGSCLAIQNKDKFPQEFCPEPLGSNTVKDTIWQEAKSDISLCAIPTTAPIPYGIDIKLTIADEIFVEEIAKNLTAHSFWVKSMVDTIEQADIEDTANVAKQLLADATKTTSSSHDPCKAATKGYRNATITASRPLVDIRNLGQRHVGKQEKVRTFFKWNPTPARIINVDDDDERISVMSTTTTAAAPPGLAASAPPAEFYGQMIKMMKRAQQAPQHPQNIVVESHNPKESVDLAKLNTSMLKLMYATAKINWEENKMKNVHLATFSRGFNDLLDRTATVQVTQLTNLLKTVFTENDEDDMMPLNPLNRLMSLVVFP
jgi:hypothetical protein